MPRVNWDQYEVAKLIEAYWVIHNNPSSKSETLRGLSELLRLYGISRGFAIDEKYRNYNGIALQISYIEGIFSNGRHGLLGASVLFQTMTTMYLNVRNQFDEVLAEANKRMHVAEDRKATPSSIPARKEALPLNRELNAVEEAFFEYLANRTHYSRNEAIAFLKKAADYCKYAGTILGETDVMVVRNIQQKIAAGLTLRFRYGKKEATQIRGVIDHYYAFVKSYRKSSSVVVSPKQISSHDMRSSISEAQKNKRDYISTEVTAQVEWILKKLHELNLCFQDKRHLGGCLWVVGSHELDDLMTECEAHGYKFYFKPEGCNTFPNTPAWWTKDGETVLHKSNAPICSLSPEDTSSLVEIQQSEKTIQTDSAPWEMYRTVLLQGFAKGFQKESGLDLRKLRKRWIDIHGEELSDSDETVRSLFSIHCVDTGKRWYLSEQLLSDNDRAIVLEYIKKVLASGKTVLYYASIYAALELELESTILTSDLLAKYLQATLTDVYYLSDRYLSTDADVQVNVADEIREVMVAYGKPIHTNELKAQLHHLPSEQVERELHLHHEFIMDANHMYFHEAIIDLSEHEKDDIAAFIQNILDEQGYMIGNCLYRVIGQQYPEVTERMSCLSELGVRDVIAYKLRDRFTFTGAVITPKGTAMNMIDIFAMYCQRNAPFSLDDLTTFAGECGVPIYWDTVHRNCVRVSEDSFVSISDVHWDVQRIDSAIALACPGQYVVLQKIQHFDAFPHIGYPWNNYLLEQYVASVSEQFDLMHNSYAKERTSGVIVRKSAGFESFDEVLADLLAKAPVTLERSPCLDYLAEQGCIIRKRLGTISEIIARAKLLRTQKG